MGFTLCEPLEMQLLASEIRASAADVRRVAEAVSLGGYYLFRAARKAGEQSAEPDAEQSQLIARPEDLQSRWDILARALSAMVAQKQTEQLRSLAEILKATSHRGATPHTDSALLRLLTPSLHEKTLHAYSSLPQLHQPRLLAPTASMPNISSLHRSSLAPKLATAQKVDEAQEDSALVDSLLSAYHNDATVALCERLIAPKFCVTPITEKATAALKADGADEGAVGLRRNIVNWASIPLIHVVDGYREAPAIFRCPRKWWDAKGRHTLRMLVC
jgi:hypothetical protein